MENHKTEGQEKTATPKKTWVTEGVVLAALPVFAYALCILYEAGYCKYFFIPISLIKVTIADVVKALGFVLFIGAVIYFIFFIPLQLISKKFGIITKRLLMIPSLALVSVFLSYVFDLDTNRTIIIVSLGIITSVLVFFVEPLFTCRDIGTYRGKLRESTERGSNILIGHKYLLKFSFPTTFLILMVILSLSISYMGGTAQAKRQRYFIVADNETKRVILKIYGNMAVCGYFDENEKILKNHYVLINMENDETNFEWKIIGPLKPEKEIGVNLFNPFEIGDIKTEAGDTPSIKGPSTP